VGFDRTSALTSPSALRLRRGLPLRSQMIRGDSAALTAVYERHHQALYRYCRSILRDEEEAWDALQSTMAKAVAALSDEQRDFEVRPWLFRIAHNEAISRLRRRREIADPDAVAAASIDSLAQTVEDRERLAHLQTDLQDLHERQRAALVLRELCGLSHEEIAGVLDSTPRAIKQTIKLLAVGAASAALLVGPSLAAGDPPGTPGPDASPAAKAKAYGVHCQGESKKHVAGQKGTPYSQCIKAAAKLAAKQKHS
jgi:RNA polymerase sigma factor (sigma-70 family)